MKEFDIQTATDAEVFDELDMRLIKAQTASCTCATKTPDPQYHRADCRYRTLCGAQAWMREFRARYERSMARKSAS